MSDLLLANCKLRGMSLMPTEGSKEVHTCSNFQRLENVCLTSQSPTSSVDTAGKFKPRRATGMPAGLNIGGLGVPEPGNRIQFGSVAVRCVAKLCVPVGREISVAGVSTCAERRDHYDNTRPLHQSWPFLCCVGHGTRAPCISGRLLFLKAACLPEI